MAYSSVIVKNKSERNNIATRGRQGSFFKAIIQPKLTINQPNDIYEQEADAMADKVMRMPDASKDNNLFFKPSISSIQRKCAHCEEEERQQLRRKEMSNAEASASNELDTYVSGLSGGQPLAKEVKSFFEPRIGYDFGSVKVHTDSIANKSAKSINALAYTHGNNVVFSNGQYAPDTESGKRLIGHELAHVVQQNKNINLKKIQRCPDTASNAEFDTKAAQVRSTTAFSALSAADRTVAEEIITLSRARADCIFFIDRLIILFNTPVDQSPAVSASTSAVMQSAADQERARLATPEGRRLRFVEERRAADPSRRWETLSPPARGWGHMATFRIDRSDPTYIVVQVKIHVTGNPTDVANIVAQEDGIEKGAAELGYTLDVIFVNTDGPDIFTVTVNPALPEDAGNWSTYNASPSGYTHEIHHLLGLEDRYDYTSHASNTRMDIHNRLYWFRIEAGRPRDAGEAQSLMGRGSHLQDDDICRTSQLDFATCMSARSARRARFNVDHIPDADPACIRDCEADFHRCLDSARDGGMHCLASRSVCFNNCP